MLKQFIYLCKNGKVVQGFIKYYYIIFDIINLLLSALILKHYAYSVLPY